MSFNSFERNSSVDKKQLSRLQKSVITAGSLLALQACNAAPQPVFETNTSPKTPQTHQLSTIEGYEDINQYLLDRLVNNGLQNKYSEQEIRDTARAQTNAVSQHLLDKGGTISDSAFNSLQTDKGLARTLADIEREILDGADSHATHTERYFGYHNRMKELRERNAHVERDTNNGWQLAAEAISQLEVDRISSAQSYAQYFESQVVKQAPQINHNEEQTDPTQSVDKVTTDTKDNETNLPLWPLGAGVLTAGAGVVAYTQREKIAKAAEKAKEKVEKIQLPRIEKPHIELPRISKPTIQWPRITIPQIELPKVSLPTMRRPRISLPEWAKVKIPTLNFNKINSYLFTKYERISNSASQFMSQLNPVNQIKNIQEKHKVKQEDKVWEQRRITVQSLIMRLNKLIKQVGNEYEGVNFSQLAYELDTAYTTRDENFDEISKRVRYQINILSRLARRSEQELTAHQESHTEQISIASTTSPVTRAETTDTTTTVHDGSDTVYPNGLEVHSSTTQVNEVIETQPAQENITSDKSESQIEEEITQENLSEDDIQNLYAQEISDIQEIQEYVEEYIEQNSSEEPISEEFAEEVESSDEVTELEEVNIDESAIEEVEEEAVAQPNIQWYNTGEVFGPELPTQPVVEETPNQEEDKANDKSTQEIVSNPFERPPLEERLATKELYNNTKVRVHTSFEPDLRNNLYSEGNQKELLENADAVFVGDLDRHGGERLMEILTLSDMIDISKENLKRFNEAHKFLSVMTEFIAVPLESALTSKLDLQDWFFKINENGELRVKENIDLQTLINNEFTETYFGKYFEKNAPDIYDVDIKRIKNKDGIYIISLIQKAFADLHNIIDTIQWVPSQRKLKLCGDAINDRHASDSIVLHITSLIRNQAKELGYENPIEVTTSNHDLGLMKSLYGLTQDSIYLYRSSILASLDQQYNDRAAYDEYFSYMRSMDYNPMTKTLLTHSILSEEISTISDDLEFYSHALFKRRPQNEQELCQLTDLLNSQFSKLHSHLVSNEDIADKKLLRETYEFFRKLSSVQATSNQKPLYQEFIAHHIHGHTAAEPYAVHTFENSNHTLSDYNVVNLNTGGYFAE